MRLKEISIEGFRAFNEHISFQFHDELTIIVGNNGTGKTSLCDAIQWGLFGKLPQYKNIPEAKEEDMILNRNNVSREANVEIMLKDSKGQAIKIKSRVKSKKIVKPTRTIKPRVLEGDPENRSKLDEITLDDFLTTVYLRQEALRKFIEADPQKERRPVLSSLLGIGFIEAMQQGLEEGTKKLNREKSGKDKELDEIRNSRRTYLERLSGYESLRGDVIKQYKLGAKELELPFAFSTANTLLVELQSIARLMGKDVPLKESMMDLTSLREFQREFSRIVSQWRIEISQDFERFQTLIRKRDELKDNILKFNEKAITNNISNFGRRLKKEKEKLRTKSAYVNLLSFTQDYLELVTLPECPVCRSNINVEDVLNYVRTTVQRLDESREVESIRQNIENLENRKKELEGNLQDFCKLKEELEKIEHELKSYKKIEGIHERLEKLYSEVDKLDDVLKVIEEEIGISRLEVPSGDDLDRMERYLQNLVILLNSVSTLYEGSEKGLTSFVQKRLEKLNPIIDHYTSILPPHPEFSRLRITRSEDGSYWLHGISSEEAKITHVRTLFSTAQLNEVAIVLLLSMAETAPHDLKFLILDDPSQSLASKDLGMHKERLARLIVEASTKKQAIVATMDFEFAKLLKSLKPNAQAYLFKDYIFEKGPVVEKW